VADKDRKGKKNKLESVPTVIEESESWWEEDKPFDAWFINEDNHEHQVDVALLGPPALKAESKDRIEIIKRSYDLLKQFTQSELKVLLTLKRNTSPKAWTVREDLLVLTLSASNKETAELLQYRNKEAVKKRLQLLRAKGLDKRDPDSADEAETEEDEALNE
jgi:hypothetical protein